MFFLDIKGFFPPARFQVCQILFYNFLPDEFMFRYIKEKNPSFMRSTRMYSVNNSKQGHDRQWMGLDRQAQQMLVWWQTVCVYGLHTWSGCDCAELLHTGKYIMNSLKDNPSVFSSVYSFWCIFSLNLFTAHKKRQVGNTALSTWRTTRNQLLKNIFLN